MTDKLLILEKINLSWNSFILWLLIAFQINSGSGVTGMIEWGRKEKPRKIPEPKIYRLNQSHAEFLKFPLNIKLMIMLYFIWMYSIHRTTQPGYMGTTTNLQIVLKTQKIPTNIRKNSCHIFLPKKIPEWRISNPKNSIDHPHHLKSRAAPFPLPLGLRPIKY